MGKKSRAINEGLRILPRHIPPEQRSFNSHQERIPFMLNFSTALRRCLLRHRAIVLTALFLLACCVAGISRAAEPQGVLEIQIKDHRDAIGDFAKLSIVIDKILVSPKAGLKIWQTGWKELNASTEIVDLTKYIGKPTARVLRSNIDAGSFDAFHLKLKNIDGVLKKNQKAAPVKNTIGPVKLSFEVPAKGETILVIDLTVVDLSDHPPRGYELGIRGYELYTNGKLLSKVPPG
jgi:uncharacterized protein DUF4382